MSNLPDVISRYFKHDTDRDIDSIVSLFTKDATVIDEGEERQAPPDPGLADRSSLEIHVHDRATGTEALGPDRYLVSGRLTGNFPGGTADLNGTSRSKANTSRDSPRPRDGLRQPA